MLSLPFIFLLVTMDIFKQNQGSHILTALVCYDVLFWIHLTQMAAPVPLMHAICRMVK